MINEDRMVRFVRSYAFRRQERGMFHVLVHVEA